MKFSALLAFFLAMATSMVGHTDFNITKCRDYLSEVDENLTAVKLVEMDLVNGKWTAVGNDLSTLTYLFGENGTLHQFNEDRSGNTSYGQLFWNVITMDKKLVLKLTAIDHDEKWMNIEQTCEGITLANLSGNEILTIGYQPFSVPKKMDAMENSLLGEWTNVTVLQTTSEPAKTAGAYVNINFDTNGSFVHEYGNRATTVIEKGQWEISRDGQFLLLHIHESNEPISSNGVKVIKINQMDDHGLVLEDVMKEGGVGHFFDTKNRVFTFIR